MSLIHGLLLLLSVVLECAKTVFSNSFSKAVLKSDTDIYKFNTFMYIGSFAVMLCFGVKPCSLYTVFTAFLFALVTAGSQIYLIKALSVGPMAFTSFLQGSSLVLPSIFGVLFLKEDVTLLQIIALPILLFSMVLVLNVTTGGVNSKWLWFSFCTFAATGGIGILQSLHQASSHAHELVSFLQLAFLFTVFFNFILWRVRQKQTPANFTLKSTAFVQAFSSGVFMGAVNYINLYLAGVLPKIIFFPLVNGGFMLLMMLASVVIFRERALRKQWLGMVVGIVALCLFGM